MAPDRSEHEYQVAAWWTCGRTGIAKSRSSPNAIHFTVPKSFGGLEGRWTPEELLLAAISGCFTTTFRTIVSKAESDFTVGYFEIGFLKSTKMASSPSIHADTASQPSLPNPFN